MPEGPEDPVAPVVHVADLRGIEEDPEGVGGESSMLLEDVVPEGGDPAGGPRGRAGRRFVVLTRVAEEDLVRGIRGRHGITTERTATDGTLRLPLSRQRTAGLAPACGFGFLTGLGQFASRVRFVAGSQSQRDGSRQSPRISNTAPAPRGRPRRRPGWLIGTKADRSIPESPTRHGMGVQ